MATKIPYTLEDQLILVRAAERGQLAVIANMFHGNDEIDGIRMLDREIGKANDAEAQEEFHAWAQACRDDEGY